MWERKFEKMLGKAEREDPLFYLKMPRHVKGLFRHCGAPARRGGEGTVNVDRPWKERREEGKKIDAEGGSERGGEKQKQLFEGLKSLEHNTSASMDKAKGGTYGLSKGIVETKPVASNHREALPKNCGAIWTL